MLVLKHEQKMFARKVHKNGIKNVPKRTKSVVLVSHYGIELPCMAFCGPVWPFVVLYECMVFCSLCGLVICNIVPYFAVIWSCF